MPNKTLFFTLLSLTFSKASSFSIGARNEALRPSLQENRSFAKSSLLMNVSGGASEASTTDNTKASGILDKLTKVSNFASLLCVVDCTVLPVVTLLLPLLGLTFSSKYAALIDQLGHQIAIYFVLPVGGSAATLNFVQHKKIHFFLSAILGLGLIYLSNGHGGLLNLLSHDFVHMFHCGTLYHRIANVAGCALLLGSNYFGHRATCCNHDHDHDHKHSSCETTSTCSSKSA